MTFKIVKAEETDYQLFASVIQEVYEALEQKEWFAADNAEYTYHMLKDCNGVGYKAVHEPSGAVAGIFLVTFPGILKKIWGVISDFGGSAFVGGPDGFRSNSSAVPWSGITEKADAKTQSGN